MKSSKIAAALVFSLALLACDSEDMGNEQVFSSYLVVTPASMTIIENESRTLTATSITNLEEEDVTALTQWSSSDPAVATVAEDGTITAVKPGFVKITGIHERQSGEMVVTVTPMIEWIEVAPLGTLATMASSEVQATAIYSDNTRRDVTGEVVWSTSNPAIGTIAGGVFTAGEPGTVTVSASLNGLGNWYTVPVTVSASALETISVVAASATLPAGFSQDLRAIGTFADGRSEDFTSKVTWTSSDEDAALVALSGSTLNAVAEDVEGDVTITATLDSVSGAVEIRVNQATLTAIAVTVADTTLPIDAERQAIATGTFDEGTMFDITGDVTWALVPASEDAPVAVSLSAGGAVGAVLAGVAKVSATYSLEEDVSVTGEQDIRVTDATLGSIDVVLDNSTGNVGGLVQAAAVGIYSDGLNFDLTNKVVWSSSDREITQAHNGDGIYGLIELRAAGNAIISAVLDGRTGLQVLAVTSQAGEGSGRE